MTYFHLYYLLFDLHCSFNFLSVLQNFSSHFLHSFPAAQPVLFKTQLQNLERQAGESASLCCETTKPGASVIWRCGGRVLASSSKYHLKQEGTVVELVIYKLQGADSGEYSCDTGSQRTSAILTVQGRIFLFKTFFVVFFFLCTVWSRIFSACDFVNLFLTSHLLSMKCISKVLALQLTVFKLTGSFFFLLFWISSHHLRLSLFNINTPYSVFLHLVFTATAKSLNVHHTLITVCTDLNLIFVKHLLTSAIKYVTMVLY